MASRHLSRALVLQTLFECDMMNALTTAQTDAVLERNSAEFALGDSDMAFAEGLLEGVLSKRTEIDEVIAKAAPQWPIDKIAPIDRNVLRIGLYELLFGDRAAVPPKVALNEAIEIGKSFGGDASGKFVNGVLGAVYRDIGEPQKGDAPKTAEAIPHDFLGGAVVVCVADGLASVALVHDAFNHWTLPKATCAEGELTENAAKRAIAEELGVSAEIVGPLSENTYKAHEPKRGNIQRTVAYFLATIDATHELKCRVCEGITEARWYAESELASLPIYEDLRGIITAGIEKAKSL